MSAPATPLVRRLAPAPAPVEQGARPRHALLLSVCCLAQFMVILDVSIVNVALPSIQGSLGFSDADLQWVVNAYTITFAGFLMLSGRAADLLGGRRTFMTGLLLFALASLAGGTAADREVLIGARALQGLGGAVMAASSLAIITSSFAAGPERHRAIGLWGAMNGAGGATGTLLGGIITEELSWRWVLLINLPIGIVAVLIARAVVVDRPREQPVGGFDLAGALAVTGGLVSLVYGIVSAGAHGWGSLAALGPIGLGLALLAGFVVIEGRVAAAPLVPLRVFANRLLRVSNIVVVLFSAALFPMWYFCSLYLQKVLHMGPLDAGLAFLPMALTIMACATQAGGLVGRFGAGPLLGVGLTLMAAGLALFAARIAVNGNYLSNFLLPSLLVSSGVGLSVVPSTIAATATAAPSEAGLASGLVNTSRQMGGALGLAVLASLAVLFTSHLVSADYRAPILAVTDGFRLAFLLGAGFVAVGALVAFMFIPRALRAGAPSPSPSSPSPSPPPSTPQPPPSAPTPPSTPTPPSNPSPTPVAVDGSGGDRAAAVETVPPVHVAPAARVQQPGPQTPATAGGRPGEPSARAEARSAPARPVARVVLSLAGGGSWALAGGSMTLHVANDA
jgi:EmrB/QacA subfamily drug resistance transporter